MNKVAKICSIIGGGLVLIGLLISIICFSALGFDHRKLDVKNKHIKKVMEFDSNSVESIETDLANKRIIIKPSLEDKITVSYYESSYDIFTCIQQGNIISLSNTNVVNWYDQIRFGIFMGLAQIGTQDVLIEVPNSFAGDLRITTSNASVSLEQLSMIKKIEVNTSNGSISFNDISSAEIVLKTSNAHMKLDTVKATKSIIGTTSNGKISVSKTEAKKIDLKTSSASIELVDVSASDKISMQSSNGKIRVDQIISDDIYLKTSNGSIKGFITGKEEEYQIHSKTTNGSNNLPSSWGSGEKRLDVNTSNSSIHIEFTE